MSENPSVATTNAEAEVSTQNHITVAPPEDDEVMGTAEEVDYSELYNHKPIKDEFKSVINALPGHNKKDAEKTLKGLQGKDAISSYRFVPLGSGFTQDYVSDRVQAFVDNKDMVVEVKIG